MHHRLNGVGKLHLVVKVFCTFEILELDLVLLSKGVYTFQHLQKLLISLAT